MRVGGLEIASPPPPPAAGGATPAGPRLWPGALLAGLLVTLVYLPHVFFGLYMRDEGRLLTLAQEFWRGDYPFGASATALSLWLAGGLQELTAPLGLTGPRLLAAVAAGAMAGLGFPILRRFMPAAVAVAALVGTALAVDYTYVRLICYRNLPALGLYAGVLCLAASGLMADPAAPLRRAWLILSGVLLGLACAAWVSSAAGLAVFLVPGLWLSLRERRIAWGRLGTGLMLVGLALAVWAGVVLILGSLYTAPDPAGISLDPRHSLGAAGLWRHALDLLAFYGHSAAKAFNGAAWYLLVWGLAGLALAPVADWRARAAGGLTAALLGWLTLGQAGLLWFLALAGAGLAGRPWGLGLAAAAGGALLAWRLLGPEYALGALVIAGLRLAPGRWRGPAWAAALGLATFGAAQYLGVKYWHIPLLVCLLVALFRLVMVYAQGRGLNGTYLAWLVVALLVALATMAGSAVGMRKVEAALWLLLPLGFFGRAATLKEGPGRGGLRAGLDRWLAGLLVAMALSGLAFTPETELHRWQLTELVPGRRAGITFTSPGRAASTASLLEALESRVAPGDQVLAYGNIPLVNYLTATRPYLWDPWIDAMSPAGVRGLLALKTARGELPAAVVRALADTRSAHWGQRATRYVPYGPLAQVDRIIGDWAREQGYEVAWQSRDFQVLTRPRAD